MGIYRQARKGKKHSKRLDLGKFTTWSYQFRFMMDEFRRVKYDHKPRFDEMYSRKLLCLLYLQAIEAEAGQFAAKDIFSFFLSNLPWSKEYFERLEKEGWIIRIQSKTSRSSHVGVLSPFFNEFVQLLRRRLEVIADEIDPNKVDGLPKNSRLRKEILAREAKESENNKIKEANAELQLIDDLNQQPTPIKAYPEQNYPPPIVEEPISKAQPSDIPSLDDLFCDLEDNR